MNVVCQWCRKKRNKNVEKRHYNPIIMIHDKYLMKYLTMQSIYLNIYRILFICPLPTILSLLFRRNEECMLYAVIKNNEETFMVLYMLSKCIKLKSLWFYCQ